MERKITREEFLTILKNPPPDFIKVSYIKENKDEEAERAETICFEGFIFENFQLNDIIEIDRYVEFKNIQLGTNVRIGRIITTKSITFNNISSVVNSYSYIELVAKRLTFNGSSNFQGGLNIRNSDLKLLSFSNLKFEYHVTIEKSYIEEVILSAFLYVVFLKENRIENLRAYGGEIQGFHFSSGEVRYIGIYGPIKLREAFITGGNIGLIYINSVDLEQIKIQKSYDRQYDLNVDTICIVRTGKNHISTITNVLLKKLHFDETFASRDSIIRIYDIGIEDLFFSNFINYGQINLTNVMISNTLSFTSSDVGKLSFIACNLENAFLDFSKSKIIETFIIGSDFPMKFKEGNSEEDKVVAYGQIKKIYENRGAQKNALEYYSLEMNALANTDIVKENVWEKINLWLNGLSTNHGVSWQRGLITTLLVSLGFYAIYVLSLGEYGLDLSDVACWQEFGKVLSYYFEFVNPAHRTDIIATELGIPSPSSISRVVEGFSRIAIAYFIYQLIQAFRKHGKK